MDTLGRPIEAAIFDMDGLLIDSEPFWRQAEREVFGAVGVHLTDAMCEDAMGLRLAEVIQHWYRRFRWPEPDFEKTEREIIHRVGELIRTRGVLLPGARKAVEFCRKKNVKTALASASATVLIDSFIRRFEMNGLFNILHSAEHEDYGKPHPAVFLSTAEKLGVHPTHCIVLEDSFNGMVAAKAARMVCIVVPEPRAYDDSRWAIADAKLRSLEHFDEDTWQTLQKIS